MAVKTNQYGTSYAGNDDFRGFLAADNVGSPYDLGLSGYGPLNAAGTSKLLLSKIGNDGRSGDKAFDKVGQQLYAAWQATRVAPSNTGTIATGGGSGSSGGGYSSAAVAAAPDPSTLAYYDDEISAANDSLGRIGAQRDIGNKNIDSSYNSAYNKLMSSNAVAERDAGIARQSNIDAKVGASAKVDAAVGRQSNSLRRLLGSNTSAGMYAAPLAVAKQGQEQQSTIQTGFAKNSQKLDLADGDRKRNLDDNTSDLNIQRDTQRNTLEAGLKQNEASILDNIMSLSSAKSAANNQTYEQAKAATSGYASRLKGVLDAVDRLGLNPSITAKNVSFTAPTLDSYDTAGTSVTAPTSQAQQTGRYYNLLGITPDEKKKDPVYV